MHVLVVFDAHRGAVSQGGQRLNKARLSVFSKTYQLTRVSIEGKHGGSACGIRHYCYGF